MQMSLTGAQSLREGGGNDATMVQGDLHVQVRGIQRGEFPFIPSLCINFAGGVKIAVALLRLAFNRPLAC